METLGIKTTFATSGVTFEIKQDGTGDLFVCLSGGTLQPILDAHNLTALELATTILDVQRLGRLTLLASQIKAAVG